MTNIIAIPRRPLPKDREDSAIGDVVSLPELPDPSEAAAEILALFADSISEIQRFDPTFH